MTAEAEVTAQGHVTRAEISPRDLLPRRLLQVVAEMSGELELGAVLHRICRACVEIVSTPAAVFLLIEGNSLVVAAQVGVDSSLATTILEGNATLRDRLARGERVTFPDTTSVLRDRSDVLPLLRGLRSAVATPVTARGQLVGALVALFPLPHRSLAPEEAELLDLLAAHGGVAVANALSFDEARRGTAQLRSVIDALADGVAVLDGYGLVTRWNSVAEDLTGTMLDAAIGRPFPLPLGSVEEPAEVRLPDDRWVEVVASPLHIDDEGSQVVVLRDISRQKALDAAKTMFVATTSHELKTPLTVIKSFAEWLRDNIETAAPDRRRLALDAIADSAEELHQIVEKILLTARTEAGALDIDPQPLEVTRLVEAIAAQFSVAGHNHQLSIRGPAAALYVNADPQAVRTALGQLLENAFKYSPDGGAVTVEIADTGDGFAEISVADQGIGLAPGEADYLFLAFYQGETRARSRVRGGVGLGLSIVRRLIEAHGGKVGASGAPGEGARFWFTLPLVDLDALAS